MATERIGWGDQGSRDTLNAMRRVINAALTDPLVLQTARRIVGVFPSRDYDAHALAVKSYLQEHFQFVRDPRGVEMLSTPRYLLTEISRRYIVQGDCDDAAILGAALAKAIGLRARLTALSFFTRATPFSHVYTVIKGRRWWSLDITRPARMAVEPPVARTLTVEV